MEALDALLNRVSIPRVREPAPAQAQLDLMFRAALRAPDHGQLRPWRFLTIQGAALERLGETFAGALGADAAPEALAKARSMPLRAPVIVVVIARLQAHFKVPEQEQLIAAGCAAHGLLLAAHAQGVGAVWRTGEFSYSAPVNAALGLGAGEQIIGFMYIGTPQGEARTAPELKPDDFVTVWEG